MHPSSITLNYKLLLLFLPLIFTCCLKIAAQVNADFTINKTGGCAPLSVNFTNTTSGASANAVYFWNFGNGNSSAIVNPAAIYIDEKTYDVTLTVKDGNLSATKTKQVTVYTPPLVDFTVSPIKGCLPVTASFNATASSAGNIYTWDFGDGNTQQDYNSSSSHTYTVPQTATVSLTVSNSYGCTKTVQKDNLIKILPFISAAFSANKTFLCRVTDAVQFSNTSAGPGTLTYLWNFGDGTTSALATPSHVFNVSGTYNVSLTVTSSEGCIITNTQNGLINVDNFTSDFTVPSPLCLGSNNTFTSTSTPAPSNSEWLVDGVNAYYYYYNSLNYNFSITGQHTIELKNTFGTCRDSVTKKMVVNEIPNQQGFIASKTSICGAPVLCNFKDTTTSAIKWEWNFNSQYYPDSVFSRLPKPSFTYVSDGDFQVRLKVENAAGCTSAAYKTVSIVKPYVYFQNDASVNKCGFAQLKLRAYIYPSTDSIIGYNWSFGDGTNAYTPEIDHSFTNPGTYPVTLTYKTLSGCTGTVSYTEVNVYPKPVAKFTADSTTLCGTQQVSFTAEIAPGNYTYEWDYGDNSTNGYYGANVTTHKYNFDSTFTVRLIVNNQTYCSDTMTKINYIKVLPPFPIITSVTNTCDGNRAVVTFTQSSVKTNQLTWDFGDGLTLSTDSSKKIIQHQYAASKQYEIKLTADNAQCTVSTFGYAQVLLKQNPVLKLDKTDVCSEDKVIVTVTNYDPNPLRDMITPNYSMAYEYGDHSSFTGIVKVDDYYYLWRNEFLGTLSNFDKSKNDLRVITTSYGFGCNDTSNYVKLVSRGSTAGFEILSNNQCFKSPIVLKDTSTTNNKIVSWQWNFGDGNYQTFTRSGLVNHIYANPGNYYVSLTVTDASGCSTSTSTYGQSVTVNGPKAAFYPSSSNTYITLPVYFYNNTNNYNSNNTQYKWQFGDGAGSVDFSPSYTYNKPGQYSVKLIAFNVLTGCADTTVQVITVNNFIPAFSITGSYLTGIGCPPLLVKMTNNSYNYTSVKWDFGDGTSADNLNYPSHIYEQPGKYIITLYVYGPSGLTGTFTDSVLIQLPQGSIKTNKKEGCIGLTPTFTIATKNASNYLWDYGDGSVVANSSTTTSHQYNQPGKYIPLLMLIDSNGCSSFAPLADTINIHPNPVVVVVPQDPRICKGQDIAIVASGGTVYSWSPANGLSNAFIANPRANPTVSTSYIVTVKDNIGCTGTRTQKITVVQPGKVNAGLDVAVCADKTVQLNATGATFYQWIFSTNGLNNTAINNPVVSSLQTTTYTVTGTDEYKCFSDTALVTVKVLPLPIVSILPLQEILLGTQIPLTSITSNDVVAWNWSPADYLSCSNCASPVSTPLAQKTYTLTVTNKDGCSAKDVVVLKLQCQENRVFIPTAFSPNGDGKNDVFSIKGISIVKHLVIYSRWGTPVYERHNYVASDRSTGWDGTFKGDPLPGGTYVYFTEMECPSGGSFTRKGTVVLVR